MEETRTTSTYPRVFSGVHCRARGRALLLCCCLALGGCGDPEVPQNQSEVLRVQADQVVDRDGKSVSLRGVQFSNWIFADPADGEPASTYAEQRDYERAAAMGMNTIAFYFSWDQFEDDAAPGVYKQDAFDWLDQHIAWAKASGIRLILTLGYPPGSAQTECSGGDTLWDVPAYQQRTLALWRALAQRYASEPAIAAFDLLSNPLPSGEAEQWHALAGQLVSAIRKVDRRHILVVEPPVGTACTYQDLAATDLFRVDDPNVLYEFAADVPWSYVAQNLASQGLGDGASYPDETRLGNLDFDAECADADGGAVKCMQFEGTSHDSIPPDDKLNLQPDVTEWTHQQFIFRVVNSDFRIGIPVLQSDNDPGKVDFDDFVVNEYDESLNLVRTVMAVDLEANDFGSWYLWQGDSDGNPCTASTCGGTLKELSGAHSGNASFSLSNSTPLANLSNSNLAFPIKLHYTYEMKGWLKGEGSGPKGNSRFRLDFWKYNENGGVLPLLDQAILGLYLQSFIAWGKAQRVPLFVGELAAGRPTFMGDKGGLRWVEDMVDLLKANDLHFAYDEYHGDDFGIFPGNHGLPDPATGNQPLIDLFSRELAE